MIEYRHSFKNQVFKGNLIIWVNIHHILNQGIPNSITVISNLFMEPLNQKRYLVIPVQSFFKS